MLTNLSLVEFGISCLGTGYVYGTNGQMCTAKLIEAKRLQYKDIAGSSFSDGNNGKTYADRCKRWIGHMVRDCSGLIDEPLGVDKSAHGYYLESTKKGAITQEPEVLGVLLFMMNSEGHVFHVGMYVGNGDAIESRGVDYGVVRTKLTERKWTHYGFCSIVDYGAKESDEVLKIGSKGDAVNALKVSLNTIGYQLPYDGNFDQALADVISYEQGKNGLEVTGTYTDQFALRLAELIYNKSQAKNTPENIKYIAEANKYKNALASISAIVKQY